MDNIEQNENELNLAEIVENLYWIIKRNFLWIVLTMFIFVASGITYAYLRKPTYEANEDIIYHANLEEGYVSSSDEVITQSYFKTVIDFCKQGCVIDRANFYYDYYINHKQSYKDVSEFIKAVKGAGSDSELYYTTDKVIYETYIVESKIEVKDNSSASLNNYELVIKYSDKNYNASVNKAKILVCAIDKEARLLSEDGRTKYFGVPVFVEDLGLITVGVDFSKTKIGLISIALGAIASAALVYILEMANRTMRDKDELERIVKADVLSMIDY